MSEARKSIPRAGRHIKSGRPGAWARLRKNTLAAIGLALVALIAAISLLAPLLPLADPDAAKELRKEGKTI